MENNDLDNQNNVSVESLEAEVMKSLETTDGEASKESAPAKSPANIFCNLSLIFMIVGLVGTFFITGLISGLLRRVGAAQVVEERVTSIILSIMSGAIPVSIVMMIIARVKDRKSVYAKVLMWVWIALLILSIIVFVAIVFFIAIVCDEMMKGC